MNKKAIATPLFAIFILIILSTSIFMIKSKESGEMAKYSIGETQTEIVNTYLESEKDYLFYEKIVEVNEYKSVKEFAETLPKEIDSSFDFRQQFIEIMKENLKEYDPEISIDSKLNVNFGKKYYYANNERLNLTYEREMSITKEAIIDFSQLEKIKETGKYKIGEILNENLEQEEIYANIKIKYKSIF
jgi:hypothetical protein